MKNYVLIVGALSLFLSGAAMAQHGGTEQERRACAGNVQRSCRPILDQGDFGCWPAFSDTGKSSPCHAGRSSRTMVSDRTIGTTPCCGTIPVIVGSLSAATFPRIIRISCTRLPECHP
jgi:hypothetical protein